MFRPARASDLPAIMGIVAQAQAFLASRGVDQWQDGYPDEATMRADMEKGVGYVLERDGRVIGIATIVFDGEPTYARIYDGVWTTEEPYACIHRIAVEAAVRGTGAADEIMAAAEKVILGRGMRSVRIDTHRQNTVMQKMLLRNGYQICGVIYLDRGSEQGAERIALEKRI